MKIFYNIYLRSAIYTLAIILIIILVLMVNEFGDAWEYLETPFQKIMGYFMIVLFSVTILLVPIFFSVPHILIGEKGIQIRQSGRLKLISWDSINTVQFDSMLGVCVDNGTLWFSNFMDKKTEATEELKSRGIEIESIL